MHFCYIFTARSPYLVLYFWTEISKSHVTEFHDHGTICMFLIASTASSEVDQISSHNSYNYKLVQVA